MFTSFDVMYELQALVYAKPGTVSIGYALSLMPNALKFRKVVTASLTLMWCSICCVKFSFLALFKRLVRQMPGMTRYWYFTVVFNVAVFLYGGTVYAIACPYFTEENIVKSGTLCFRIQLRPSLY